MAAFRFVRAFRRDRSMDDFAITLICEEPVVPYDRVHLGQLLEGADAETIELRPAEWYQDRDVTVLQKDRAVRIDRATQSLSTESGRVLHFDRLILATGGYAFKPPVSGAQDPRVLTYRTIEDVYQIADRARRARKVIVAGGGLLGIEAARAIQKLGADVEIIEQAPRLLPRQLDAAGAELLERQVRALGIRLRTLTRIVEIESEPSGLRCRTAEDLEITADFLVFAAGIRPRDELARGAGIDCEQSGGIVVDDTLETSAPGVYAIGECARHRGQLYGFVAPCNQMAEVLAARFRGEEARFEGAVSSARLKLDEVDVAAVGDSLADGPTYRELAWVDDHAYRRIVLKDHRIVGAIAIGPGSDFPNLQSAIAEGFRVRPWHERRFARKGRIWRESQATSVRDWPDAAIVCTCTGVPCGALRRAAAGAQATSQSISKQTGAGTVCGSCIPLLEELAGERERATRVGAGAGLAISAGIGLMILALAAWIGPIPFSTSVQDSFSVDFLWRDAWWKQATGFGLLGLCVASLALSLRKKAPQLDFGEFRHWRLAHTVVGVGALLVAGIHTGLRFGENLNRLLMLSFVAVAALGMGAALVTSLEHRLPAPYGALLRRCWTAAHIFVTWPIPVLLGFHVLAVYMY